jgi:ethanolamine utilization protein EutJ
MIKSLEKIEWMVNHPERWDFSGTEELYAGVDLGTYKTIAIVVDERGNPRAANMRRAEVVRSGLILDYLGALNIVKELIEEIRYHAPLPVERGATSYPPQTESANVDTTTYVLQGAGVEVLSVLDEPTAANQVLRVNDGAIVDVGGGTTGVAVLRGGEVIYSNDEATGGIHLSLVLAGHLKIGLEEAEALKTSKQRNGDILPIVGPVIEKISSIVATHLKAFEKVNRVWLVGGTCELEGFTGIVGNALGLEASKPPSPQMVTPFGIALSCLDAIAEEKSKFRIEGHALR